MSRGFEKISLEQWYSDTNSFVKYLNTSNKFDKKIILDSTEHYNDIILPKRGTKNSAGYDIYCPFEITLYPKESIKIPTGIKAYMQSNEFLMIVPRSSMGFKYFMRLANTIAIGDSDYYNNSDNEGHYWIKIRNESTEPFTINKGQAFAQGIFMPFLLTDNDNVLTERTGGIGSTDGK